MFPSVGEVVALCYCFFLRETDFRVNFGVSVFRLEYNWVFDRVTVLEWLDSNVHAFLFSDEFCTKVNFF